MTEDEEEQVLKKYAISLLAASAAACVHAAGIRCLDREHCACCRRILELTARLLCFLTTMGVQEESESLLPHGTASKQAPGAVAVQQGPNKWRGSLLGCCSGCDSDAWGSCLLGYFVPCVAFGCALHYLQSHVQRSLHLYTQQAACIAGKT